ncbi:hypothetical protein TRIATDRAFT_288479 [Trichoderma atroviride IMI 206040]|uniref:HTH CENPB-type domain-containing protein n=1 Tax=Hypocrea atroviridis (strain ATCC 20476 / IMI 206040) TaxID=452589 RepID=G9PBL1_HYPAI|nr:uncharacterized protein TRIATDRAFT_288479 [Trichoderma atroviride IMI 206040]EHK39755.1 hypothetical protein TRIATDRAFT_288479 [Trichoderma atroviride IMI 206040]
MPVDEFPAAFKAAAAILADRDRAQIRGQKPLSIRNAAVKFNTSPSAVQRALSSLQKPDPIPRSPGRPRSLMNAEDEALVAFVMWFQRAGFQITKSQLVSAANDIRRRRDPEFEDVGKNWYCRWLQDHPEVQKSCFKPENKPGVSYEASSAEILLKFFGKPEEYRFRLSDRRLRVLE